MSAKAKTENSPIVVKPYQKPALVKGPVLTDVTAFPAISGIPSDGVVCWVARAAFGENDFRWMIFRAWLLEDSPRWLRRGYISYGERVGVWVARHEIIRGFVRGLMMLAIRRKTRG